MSLLPAESVLKAAARIGPFVKRTRMIRSQGLSTIAGTEVRLKLENEQRTGSIKLRGALNAILQLERSSAVVTASAGNHGLGVAHAARFILAIPF